MVGDVRAGQAAVLLIEGEGDAERPAAGGGAPDLRYQIVEKILDLLEASPAGSPLAAGVWVR